MVLTGWMRSAFTSALSFLMENYLCLPCLITPEQYVLFSQLSLLVQLTAQEDEVQIYPDLCMI